MARNHLPSTYELRRSRPCADRPPEARAAFIQRTYLHLFGAILGFAAIEAALVATPLALPIAVALLRASWPGVIGGLVLAGWLAARGARRAKSPCVQYAALVGAVLAQAVLCVPIALAARRVVPGAIESGTPITLLGFTGLTVAAFSASRDFSFLAGLGRFAGSLALVLIAAGAQFGFGSGVLLCVAVTAFTGGVILHDTPHVLERYPEDGHVGAALALLASVSLLPWRLLRRLLWREEQGALRPAA